MALAESGGFSRSFADLGHRHFPTARPTTLLLAPEAPAIYNTKDFNRESLTMPEECIKLFS